LCIGLFVLTAHFALVLIYANPFEHGKTKMGYYAQAYVYPYFHQNWNLFAPPPTSNYTLLATYNHNGNKTVDVFNEMLVKHQTNRLSGYEPLLIAFSNSIHYFEKNTQLKKLLNGPILDDPHFNMLEHAVGKYLEVKNKIHLSQLRLLLIVEDDSPEKQRLYFNK
jgi:hypothetical protein